MTSGWCADCNCVTPLSIRYSVDLSAWGTSRWFKYESICPLSVMFNSKQKFGFKRFGVLMIRSHISLNPAIMSIIFASFHRSWFRHQNSLCIATSVVHSIILFSTISPSQKNRSQQIRNFFLGLHVLLSRPFTIGRVWGGALGGRAQSGNLGDAVPQRGPGAEPR